MQETAGEDPTLVSEYGKALVAVNAKSRDADQERMRVSQPVEGLVDEQEKLFTEVCAGGAVAVGPPEIKKS